MSKDIPFRSIRTSQSSFAVRSATQPMQMHKKPLHGHVQAYQLEVKIVSLVVDLFSQREVRGGSQTRIWRKKLGLIKTFRGKQYERFKWNWQIFKIDIFRCIQQRMEVICTKSPPPQKKKKKDNKMKNICSGSSGKGGANEEIIKWSPVPLCQTNDK